MGGSRPSKMAANPGDYGSGRQGEQAGKIQNKMSVQLKREILNHGVNRGFKASF